MSVCLLARFLLLSVSKSYGQISLKVCGKVDLGPTKILEVAWSSFHASHAIFSVQPRQQREILNDIFEFAI